MTVQPFAFADISEITNGAPVGSTSQSAWSVCDVKNMGSPVSAADTPKDYYPNTSRGVDFRLSGSPVPDVSNDMLLQHKRPTFDTERRFVADIVPTPLIGQNAPYAPPPASPASPASPELSNPGGAPRSEPIHHKHDDPDKKGSKKGEEELDDGEDEGDEDEGDHEVNAPDETDWTMSTVYIALYTITGILLILIMEQFTRIGMQLRWTF